MYISIAVNRIQGKGARDFLEALPALLENARTWKYMRGLGPLEAVIEHTGEDKSYPANPHWRLKENSAGSVSGDLINANGWTDDQKKHAVGTLIYLCLTHLEPWVKDVTISP